VIKTHVSYSTSYQRIWGAVLRQRWLLLRNGTGEHESQHENGLHREMNRKKMLALKTPTPPIEIKANRRF
jgi:hypothetical protein